MLSGWDAPHRVPLASASLPALHWLSPVNTEDLRTNSMRSDSLTRQLQTVAPSPGSTSALPGSQCREVPFQLQARPQTPMTLASSCHPLS
uniref:Uncharacterized protein n=1 Tax=Anguilla anguilla TaxID=7936 RepID=A0A0E9X5U2_ANGAN